MELNPAENTIQTAKSINIMHDNTLPIISINMQQLLTVISNDSNKEKDLEYMNTAVERIFQSKQHLRE